MLGKRDVLELRKEELGDTEKRIAIESLRYMRENDPEHFEQYKKDLQGSSLWEQFQREYG